MARKDAQLTRNAERRFCQVVVCCSNPKTELPSAVPSFACGGGEPAPDSIRGAEGGWGERGNAALLLMFRAFQERPFQPQLTPSRRSPFGPALPFASASCLCNPFSRNEETCS